MSVEVDEGIYYTHPNGSVTHVNDQGLGLAFVPTQPRKRDFLLVLFGRWRSKVDIHVMGIGQFVSPEAGYPEQHFRIPRMEGRR